MKRRIALSLTAITALLALGAADPRDEAAVNRMLAGKSPGKPRHCLQSYESQSSSVHDGLVLFRVNSRLVYRNNMNSCPLLRESDMLVTQLYGGGQLCKGDIAQIVDRASRMGKGACAYGDFVPYLKPKAE